MGKTSGKEHPRVFVSYSHDEEPGDHMDRVLGLANRLRSEGVDAILDQYEPWPKEGWTRWTEEQIEEADFVLMVCTETYFKRVAGKEKAGKGRGVIWEANLIYNELYQDATNNEKFVPVLFDYCKTEHIPKPLRGTSHHWVDDDEGYEDLYRRLTNQPGVVRPGLGKIRDMPPREILEAVSPKERQPDLFGARALTFVSTLFFNKADKRPLDDHLSGDGRLRFGGHQFGGMLSQFISKHLKDCEELNKAEFNKDCEEIVGFYHNMILVKLLDQFFWMYSARWDTNIYSVRRGTSEEKESYVDSKETPPNYDSLNWGHLSNTEQRNTFCEILAAFSNIKETKVPPKTKVDFIITEHKREMSLRNPFVKVTITIHCTGGSSGLGDFKWLLGYENKRSEEFWSAHFRVNCHAKFEKLKSGHPEMPKYKQWVEVMFAEVQYQLDEEERLKRAREYRDLIKP